MPKFKDTRKSSRTPIFNGWVDEQEPSSPLADLFTKLVPIMTTLKRKTAFHFPPPPPYPELPAPPQSMLLTDSSDGLAEIPEITDYGCDRRVVVPIPKDAIANLISFSEYKIASTKTLKPIPPLHVENSSSYRKLLNDKPDQLFVVDFFAVWCMPCKALTPLFHILSLKTPTAMFLKVDVDECDDLTEEYKVTSMPTILFIRNGAVLGKIEGGGSSFLTAFSASISKFSTKEEIIALEKFNSTSPINTTELEDSANMMGLSGTELKILAEEPLADCKDFFEMSRRDQLGLKSINSNLAFDLTRHSSAQTAPAAAVLSRFKDDVHAYASFANNAPMFTMLSLSMIDIQNYFTSSAPGVDGSLQNALEATQNLLAALHKIKLSDSLVLQETLPLLQHVVNFVDIGENKSTEISNRESKLRFLLNRTAGQNSEIWIEFLFGTLISTCGVDDLRRLNPFLPVDTANVIMDLVTMTMLKANRLGHINRCIGTAISLENMLKTVLTFTDPLIRKSKSQIFAPKLVQMVEELAKTVVMGRYYIKETETKGQYEFDPRYLVFEFVWNIQLRQKQVDIVNDFRNSLEQGRSKVKQMIMGAGKTSVVAPLLALIVADGKSLVLSVVPKALVEMSRTRLRETFAAIMVKRVYTLDFERSTIVKASMRKSLENACANRGVVVATPTTLKSIMLSYIEVLQNIKENKECGIQSSKKLTEYKTQAEELSKILMLLRSGIMLLDEVDLILHPLKSELSKCFLLCPLEIYIYIFDAILFGYFSDFPIGEKFDLDGSEDGDRWDLPIHLFDAFLYSSTGKVSSFEQRGLASDILKQIAGVIQKGLAERNLQRSGIIPVFQIALF